MMDIAWLGSLPKSGILTTCHAMRTVEVTSEGARGMPAALPTWDVTRYDAGHTRSNHTGKLYFMVKRPDYPKANNRGLAKRSHVVWWLATGQVLPDGFDIHHKNDDSLDDRIENLELLAHGEHSRKTRLLPKVDRVCETCGKQFQALARSVRIGNAKYCSHSCFASRNITIEQKAHMSAGVRAAFAEMSLVERRGY